MHRRRTVLIVAIAIVAAAIVACTLNPQPLPPFSPEDSDASVEGGNFGPEQPAPTAADAAAGTPKSDGAVEDHADAGDAGDAGDATPDADGG